MRRNSARWPAFLFACCIGMSVFGFDMAVLSRYVDNHFGSEGIHNFRAWQTMFESLRSSDEGDRVQRVHQFFNRHIRSEDDIATWGVSDYWATPLETLGKGRGDCEDFTIAKYFTLERSGVPINKLRLIYVKARIGGEQSSVAQAHMVLAYYPTPDAEPLVLDSLMEEVRPSSRRTDLIPVFSFNTEGMRMEGPGATAANATVRLSRWRDLLARMKNEGFD